MFSFICVTDEPVPCTIPQAIKIPSLYTVSVFNLQVTCLNFVALPMVMGLSLCSVSLIVSQGILHYRLQLVFGSDHLCYTASRPSISSLDCVTVVLDPVVNVRVLDWWHPMYPHPYCAWHPKDWY